MNEDYAESEFDFSGMSDDELLEIVNSGSGDYSQEAVEGAKDELKCRKDGTARIERPRRVVKAETDPPHQGVEAEAAPPVLPVTVPGSKLFSVGQITLATFFGAPVAGCLLLAQNYRALGKDSAARQSLIVGIASTILLIAIVSCLPDNFPGRGVALGSCFGMRQVAAQLQGGVINNHLKAGGRKGSWWIAFAVGVGCSVAVLGLIFGIAIALNLQ
jgi:hypothetical protein